MATFFAKLDTPIDAAAEGIENRDEVIYRLMGSLCLVYGLFILLLMLIPNTIHGRLCFLFCGGVITLAGAVLCGRSRMLATAKLLDSGSFVGVIGPTEAADPPVQFRH